MPIRLEQVFATATIPAVAADFDDEWATAAKNDGDPPLC
jgi:hypothetical protein